MRELISICYLFTPLLLGLTLHGFAIKYKLLDFLVFPVDCGAVFRKKPFFGANKTYRGLAAISIGTSMGFAIQALWLHNYKWAQGIELLDYNFPFSLWLGLTVGFAASVSELPNSFIKRQLDISPGETSPGLLNGLFFVLDQVDFLLGSWIVLQFYLRITLIRVFYSFIFLFITHQIISGLGYLLGMRKTAR